MKKRVLVMLVVVAGFAVSCEWLDDLITIRFETDWVEVGRSPQP